MRYIVPSSKIVFTDFMILLVSLLIGINSVMTFSEETGEWELPLINSPKVDSTRKAGSTDVKKAIITVQGRGMDKVYFYFDREVGVWDLIRIVRESRAPAVLLRADREVTFGWEEFCRLTSGLMQAGVKEITYTATRQGEQP